MAAMSREETIAQVQEVVKAYMDKIHRIRHHADLLPAQGERIVNG